MAQDSFDAVEVEANVLGDDWHSPVRDDNDNDSDTKSENDETLSTSLEDEEEIDENDNDVDPLDLIEKLDTHIHTTFEWMDAFAQFGASDPFIIEGDSLFAHALATIGDWTSALHVQLLSVIYVVERTLVRLQERGGKFRIIFFTDLADLWTDWNALGRQVLVEHLMRKTTFDVDIVEGCWWDEKWTKYLQNHQPAFIMMTYDLSKDISHLKYEKMHRILKGFSWYHCKYYILFLESLQFEGARVFTFGRRSLFNPEEVHRRERQARYIAPTLDHDEPPSALPAHFEEFAGNARAFIALNALENVTMAASDEDKKEYAHLARAYCWYLATVEDLPLQHRAHKIPTLPDTALLQKLEPFATLLILQMQKQLKFLLPHLKNADHLCDLFDGRLLIMVVLHYHLAAGTSQVETYWKAFLQQSHLNYTFENNFITAEQIGSINQTLAQIEVDGSEDEFSDFRLSPLQNEFVECVIPDVVKRMRKFEQSGAEANQEGRYVPNHSWKSGRDFNDPDPFEINLFDDEQKKARKRKDVQKKEAAITKFIESLLADSPVKKVTIVETDSKEEMAAKKKRAVKALEAKENAQEKPEIAKPKETKKKQAAGKKKPSKKELIIEENKKSKASKEQDRLKNKAKEFEKFADSKESEWNVKKQLERLLGDKSAEEFVDFRIQLRLTYIFFLVDKYQKDIYDRKPEVICKIFAAIQNALRCAELKSFKPEQLSKISHVARKLGFEDLAVALIKTPESNQKSIRFQLSHLGSQLVKPKGSIVDPRVPFVPDAWQVKLLNIVDAEESALVCAPTSSGKTFICFYAIESILRLDADSVVVYVAPTKALVHQMEAEIRARFSKSSSSRYAGKHMCGIFTRDYRSNEGTCQVLVTVPQCLEILLLTIMKDPEWAHRLKYVILDEIHCIGSAEGAVWEHLLLLLDCPILALSATVGNLNEFYTWMKEVEDSRGRKLHMIHHDERYNDLKPYVYMPSEQLQELNPLLAVSTTSLIKNGFPQDLKILPEHCLAAYQMLEAAKVDAKVLEALKPENYFAKIENNLWNLSLRDVAKYESDLKTAMKKCVDNESSLFKNELVLAQQKLKASLHALEQMLGEKDQYTFLSENVYSLLKTLEVKEMLPTIVFHFDRTNCEKFAVMLSTKLQKDEQDYKTKKGYYQKIKELRESIGRRISLLKATANVKSDMDDRNATMMDTQNQINEERSKLKQLEGILPEFAFLPPTGPVDLDTLEEYLRISKQEIMENPLYRALLRGLGVHHAGLGKKYRQAVERLFRLRKLQVVFATGTLAVGINMPCKTVVHAGSSPYLNALNYRQMSGRAGRRGFDLIGNVVFFGVRLDKINQLTTSRLPDLIGNMPVTMTLILRLICKYVSWDDVSPQQQKLKNIDRSKLIASTKRMVEYSFIGRGTSKQFTLQMKTYFRCAVDFLIKEGYLDTNASPLQFCGLIVHLFYLEPSNFVLASLLKSGIFENRDEEEMALIVCHLFCRIPLYQKHIAGGPSIVRLPPLPEVVLAEVRGHNRRVVQHFTNFMRCTVDAFHEELGDDNLLPASQVRFVGVNNKNMEGDSIACKLGRHAIKYKARSAFIAMAGRGDNFTNADDLINSLREGLYLDHKLLPWLSEGELQVNLNAYLYDFLKHGQKKAVLRYNKIKEDRFYENTKDFTEILKVIATALKRREAGESSKRVTAVFDQLTANYKELFVKHFRSW